MHDRDPLQRIERGWRNIMGATVVSGALALAGCSSGDKAPTPSPPAVSTDKAPAGTLNLPTTTGQKLDLPTTTPRTLDLPTTTGRTGNNVSLTFDDLHGGSPIVKVYPGPKDTPADREYNGTFNDGDVVAAECKTEGRLVSSVTSVGEAPRSSSDWVRIQGTPGMTQFATAVYIENPDQVLGQLPQC